MTCGSWRRDKDIGDNFGQKIVFYERWVLIGFNLLDDIRYFLAMN